MTETVYSAHARKLGRSPRSFKRNDAGGGSLVAACRAESAIARSCHRSAFRKDALVMTIPSPAVTGVIETALYVEDLPRAIAFYQRLFGFRILQQDRRFCAFDVGGTHVLLLFLRGASHTAMELPGGRIPPHDGSGPTHFGLSIPAGSDAEWARRLNDAGVTIESVVAWPRGGRSLYFRDPDGHAVELLTPGVWEIY